MRYWEKPFGKEKPKTICGEIHIINDRCKGCSFCIEYCPREVLELSKDPKLISIIIKEQFQNSKI